MTTTYGVTSPDAGSATITVEFATVAGLVRRAGLLLLALAVAVSPLTFNWVVEHDPGVNYFPEFGGRVIYLSDALMVAGVFLWAVGWRLFRSVPLTLGPTYVGYPLLALVVLTALSTIWADDARLAGYALTRRLLLLAVYVVLASDVRHATPLVIRSLFVATACQLVISWLQVQRGDSLGLVALGEIQDSVGCPRPTGLTFNPNPLGLFFAVTGGVAAVAVLDFAGSGLRRLTLWIVAAASIFGILLSESRSAFLSWAIGLAIVGGCDWRWGSDRRRTIRSLAVMVTVSVVLWLMMPVVAPVAAHCVRANRYAPQVFARSAADRMDDFRLSIAVIRERAWLGVGAANYPRQLTKRLPWPPIGAAFTPVHNVALLMWAELGIAGLCAWIALLIAPARWALERWRPMAAEPMELVWLLPVLVVMAVSMLDFTPWATQDGRVIFMAVMGLWAGSSRNVRSAQTGN